MTTLRIFLFLVCLPGASGLLAQENFSGPWKSVKCYLNRDLLSPFGSLAHKPGDGLPVGVFTPAFSWSRKARIMHELELPVLQFNRQRRYEAYAIDRTTGEPRYINGTVTTDYQAGLRYELAWQWLDWRSGALYFGSAAELYGSSAQFTADNAADYQSTEKIVGLSTCGVFRLLFRLSRHLYLDINTPLGYTVGIDEFSISEHGTATTGESLDFGASASVRVGLGYRF